MTTAHSLTALLAVPTLSALAVAQDPSWRPELLGTPGAGWSTLTWAIAVNDAGMVAGNTYVDGWKRAWIASQELGLQILPLPPTANWTDALDMNAEGLVVGQALVDGGLSRAVLWRPEPGGYVAELLPAGPGGVLPFSANGVNDRGDVVGKLGILSGNYVWNETDGVVQITTGEFPVTPDDINNQRQILGGNYRMDLDGMVLEALGTPTGTTLSFIGTTFLELNDIGQAVGYATTPSSSSIYVAVRYDGVDQWTLFNSFPLSSASALSISAAGDTVYQLGATFGTWISVSGWGSVGLLDLPGLAYPNWDLSISYVPAISPGGLIACTGTDTTTGQSGVVLFTPENFEFLGGGVQGALGTPVLSGYGSLAPFEPTRVRLASAAPSSVAFVAWSDSNVPVPVLGGTLHANPVDFLVTLPTDDMGRFDVTFGWPAVPPGTAFTMQAAVVDSAAAEGVSLSNGLRAVTP